MKKLLSIDINIKWYDILIFAILTLAFFSMPLLFTPDSTDYLKNAEFFAGSSEIYSAYRGPVVPFIINIFGKLFSYTIYGLTLGMYLMYLVFIFSMIAILFLLDIPKLIGKFPTLIIATIVFFLNVVILSYAHTMLTEFFIITIISIYIAVMLGFYKYNPRDKTKKIIKEVSLVLVSSIMLIVSYAVKQMFFPIILLIYFSYKVVNLKDKMNIKNILKEVIILIFILFSLLIYVSAYSNITKGENMEGESINSYASSFLIDGLRYFVPQGDIVYGEEMTIFVNNNQIEPIDSFTYTFEPGIIDGISYVVNCFINSPSRVIESYKANYGIVSGVVHPAIAPSGSRMHTYSSQTLNFDYLYESGAWIDYYKNLSISSVSYPENLGTDLSIERFQNQSVSSGLVSNLLFNTKYANLSIFFHTTAAYFSFIVFLISILFLVASKKYLSINRKWCFLNIIISFNIFPYLLFLAVTAQNIDRYGIPSIIFTGLLWIINIAYILKLIQDKLKIIKLKKSKEIRIKEEVTINKYN